MQRCEEFIRQRKIVAELKKGAELPGSPLEVAALAMVAAIDGRAEEAYEWITEALDEDERVEDFYFESVVRVAALAAKASGSEGAAKEAAEWLAEEVDSLESRWRSGLAREYVVRRRLAILLRDPDYAAARGADAALVKRIEELLTSGK